VLRSVGKLDDATNAPSKNCFASTLSVTIIGNGSIVCCAFCRRTSLSMDRIGYLVSLSALMLGFVWALVDSEA
jgi:hypothetical protein